MHFNLLKGLEHINIRPLDNSEKSNIFLFLIKTYFVGTKRDGSFEHPQNMFFVHLKHMLKMMDKLNAY